MKKFYTSCHLKNKLYSFTNRLVLCIKNVLLVQHEYLLNPPSLKLRSTMPLNTSVISSTNYFYDNRNSSYCLKNIIKPTISWYFKNFTHNFRSGPIRQIEKYFNIFLFESACNGYIVNFTRKNIYILTGTTLLSSGAVAPRCVLHSSDELVKLVQKIWTLQKNTIVIIERIGKNRKNIGTSKTFLGSSPK